MKPLLTGSLLHGVPLLLIPHYSSYLCLSLCFHSFSVFVLETSTHIKVFNLTNITETEAEAMGASLEASFT